MNELSIQNVIAPPAPKIDVSVRLATEADLPFVDTLQKRHSKYLGFLQMKALEGKIRLKEILLAEDANKNPVGYLIGNDRYFKRDDVGIIYQMNLAPEFQRSYVASALLKAQFERSAYGCKLYCCYCLKHLDHANRFWENMGFVPLAFRAGAQKKTRDGSQHVHIFWQKRIREKDQTTPWWYPSKTDNGMMREDRVLLPIGPGTHWSVVHAPEFVTETSNQLPEPVKGKPRVKREVVKVATRPVLGGGLFFGPVVSEPVVKEKPKREPKPKIQLDPKMKEAAREMRDRWLEKVNDGTFILESAGKYNVARALPNRETRNSETLKPLLAA